MAISGTLASIAAMAVSTAMSAASAAGAFDPKQPDPNAAKRAEDEARRKKMAEMAGRRGRGSSIVTGGSGLGQPAGATLGQSSILGSS